MNEALKLPGVTNAWTMPIKARIDMLTTGIRTPVGIKIYGADIKEIERIGTDIERCSRRSPARAASSPSAPRAATSSTSPGSATSSRATACPSTTRRWS